MAKAGRKSDPELETPRVQQAKAVNEQAQGKKASKSKNDSGRTKAL